LERKLAAVVAADIVGYSRLMGEDEAGTLAAVGAVRRAIIDPAIAARGGRLVKAMGDGFLLEFASAVEAVECAVEVQGRVAEMTGETKAAQSIELRIGVNVGEDRGGAAVTPATGARYRLHRRHIPLHAFR
jgi:adenylate cyclase